MNTNEKLKEQEALNEYTNSQTPTEVEMNLMAAYYGENKYE